MSVAASLIATTMNASTPLLLAFIVVAIKEAATLMRPPSRN